MPNNATNKVDVLLSNGDGTFQTGQTYGAGSSTYAVALADFNNDGVTDIVATNNTGNNASVLLGTAVPVPSDYVTSISGLSVTSQSAAVRAGVVIGKYTDAVTMVAGLHEAAQARFESASATSEALASAFEQAERRILDVDVPTEIESVARNQVRQELGQDALKSALKTFASLSTSLL
jgi:flagellin-like hook-associated protein FlgL